ncbi:MAG: ATP-binding protein, partial [Chthoniobacteraceae bacterium]
RALASRWGAAQVEEHIFEIVNQFNRSRALIDFPAERAQVASLNLQAALRAKAATAYTSALIYLAAGRELLAEDCWEEHYRLTFDLELHRAECEFVTSSFDEAEERLSHLSERATNLVDLASVVRLRMALFTTQDQVKRAVEAGLAYLDRVGLCWSPHPPDEEVSRKLDHMRELLAGRSVEALLDLAPMTDPELLATMDVLADFLTHASFTDNNLLDLAVLSMVNLSLEHGNCDASPCAYALLNLVLGLGLGDFSMAYRFGKLGCDLVEQRGFDRFKTKVYTLCGTLALPWTQHLPLSRATLRRAIEAAAMSGDVTYAAYSRRSLVVNLLTSGEPLSEVERELDQAIAFSRAARLGLSTDSFESTRYLIRGLRGEADEEELSEDPKFTRRLTEGGARLAVVAARYWLHLMQARFFADNPKGVLTAAAKASVLLWSVRPYLETVEYHFYHALAQAAAFESMPAAQRPAVLAEIEAHRRQIAKWAKGCPENHAHRVTLIAAEIARLEGRPSDAEQLYEEAVHLARTHGFVQNEGIANELAARFHSGRGLDTISDAYLRNARVCYSRWGALAKVQRLDRQHPQLAALSAAPAATIGSPLAQFDVATVLKASQALSQEIRLDDLIETLIRIVLQHAAAERGSLILFRDGESLIEAEATIGRSGTEVTLRPGVNATALPESVLNYVIRTRESVLLDDATAENPFSTDEYLRLKRPRSVLCLPILKQSKLVGALYLENDQAPHVFTVGRVAVLELLASQAAISLENARLYSDLEKENLERKRVEDELARVTRVTTMGELAASIAHEVNQPIAGVVLNGNACLRWLSGLKENSAMLTEAREAVQRIVRDGTRAGEVIARIRALFKKTETAKGPLEINEVIREVIVLTRSEMDKKRVALRLELAADLPSALGDRVQLQQVMINLILNGIEAMNTVEDRTRELIIGTQLQEPGEVLVTVRDSGTGLDPAGIEQIFAAFHTTKPGGLGMGLSISRSIVENHSGRLWVTANDGPGATFHFTLLSHIPGAET